MKRAAFVIALITSIPLAITGQEGEGPSLRPVTWERLLNAADEPENLSLIHISEPTRPY